MEKVPFFISLCRRFAAALARLGGRACFALLVALAAPLAFADGISVKTASLDLADEGWQLSAEFDITFSPRLEEAVNRGVPLYLVVDFEVARPRWYWFDEKPIQFSQTYKVSYTPLLRQYRLSVGNQYQNFTRLDEVTRVLSRLRNLQVAKAGAFAKGVPYQAGIRMRLDTAQLPKPFQLDALASRDWSLASDWYRWNVTPPTSIERPAPSANQ
ncbi:MAG TPA: DUF4390 domain-containing protein [Usitatibacter sp.]|nr:DUF4390 domain-containing protein [Usitatibacter sp.]